MTQPKHRPRKPCGKRTKLDVLVQELAQEGRITWFERVVIVLGVEALDGSDYHENLATGLCSLLTIVEET